MSRFFSNSSQTKSHAEFVGSPNWFDDDIMNNHRIRRACKGHRRELRLLEWNKGTAGDYETFCRAVALVAAFYDKGTKGDMALYRTICAISSLCLSINAGMSWRDVLQMPMPFTTLFGTVNVPGLVSWCAVMHVKGGDRYSCADVVSDNDAAVKMVGVCFASFDKLSEMQYTTDEVNVLE